MNKCTMSIVSKVGHIYYNKPNQGNWWACCAATLGLLLSHSASVTTTSALMSSASPSGRRGWGRGGGGGVRDTDSKHTEREREGERRDGCCLLWHTRASLSNSGRTERASFPHPLQENKTTFSFEWIIEDLARFYIIQHNHSLRHCRGPWVAGTERGSGVKAEGSFSTRDSDHGSNGGGGVSARWVQIPFQCLHTSSLECCSQLYICPRSNGSSFLLNCLWLVDYQNILEIEACEKE